MINKRLVAAQNKRIETVKQHEYYFGHWDKFSYGILKNIKQLRRAGSQKDKRTYNDVIIMGDTETSKKKAGEVCQNHVVAWTISIRAYDTNICTLYGHRPDTFCKCVNKIHETLAGDITIIYFHNLPYDWVFLRQFMMAEWGTPDKQLNVKPHYPLFIYFENGIWLKDSLMLAQRSLEKWAADLNVQHQKAVGKWDYDQVRGQKEQFTQDELEYIEHDTLAGVECIDCMKQTLKKRIYSIPFTATGIPREEVRKIGKKNRQRDLFLRIVPTYEQHKILEQVFHGGYTHSNRHFISRITTLDDDWYVDCYDFSSSYPYCMLAEKFPMENFHAVDPMRIDDIIQCADKYAILCKLILVKPRLKDDFQPMPVLQYSKCINTINAVCDNGRILCAAYAEIYCSEQDIITINEQYDYEKGSFCTEVQVSRKDYLPKWFRDYIYKLYNDKCHLKNGDPVLYSISKARLNSLYGLCVQNPINDQITEDYLTGDFDFETIDEKKVYQEYVNNHNSVLPYQWGVWVTAYAQRHLFELGKCIGGSWLYSDTDSCYGTFWHENLLNRYNENCKEKLKASGYGPVIYNGREYWLGIAEHDGKYKQFVTCGAKRYCVIDEEDHLKITVAGVPKKNGAKCLNTIEDFRKGFVFDGKITGKKTYTYFFNDIFEDSDGNLTGDSIDLSPCDYELDDIYTPDWQTIFTEEIAIQVYT